MCWIRQTQAIVLGLSHCYWDKDEKARSDERPDALPPHQGYGELMSGLSPKVAIVTGASKGIGSGIATALATAGARVAVNYSSDRQGAERVARAINDRGGEAIAVGADVSKSADVTRLYKEVDSAFGRLDILVNNAGVFPLRRRGWKHHQSQFDRRFATRLRERCSTTKAAIEALTKGLAIELAPRKIRVNAIAPGHTETEGNITAGTFEGAAGAALAEKIPLGRLGRVTDIAPLAVFLASDESAWITGEVIRASGGLVVAR
jgi:3-oxoacyl-[acyl-carrier protein] reductase